MEFRIKTYMIVCRKIKDMSSVAYFVSTEILRLSYENLYRGVTVNRNL